jgi:hypothetical protein
MLKGPGDFIKTDFFSTNYWLVLEGISVELKPMEIKTWRLSVIEKIP